MKYSRLALCFCMLLLCLLPNSAISAQATDTPEPQSIYATPTPLATLIPWSGLRPCRDGEPASYGQATPSPRWIMECAHCLPLETGLATVTPVSTWAADMPTTVPITLSLTPFLDVTPGVTVTVTPTPTVIPTLPFTPTMWYQVNNGGWGVWISSTLEKHLELNMNGPSQGLQFGPRYSGMNGTYCMEFRATQNVMCSRADRSFSHRLTRPWVGSASAAYIMTVTSDKGLNVTCTNSSCPENIVQVAVACPGGYSTVYDGQVEWTVNTSTSGNTHSMVMDNGGSLSINQLMGTYDIRWAPCGWGLLEPPEPTPTPTLTPMPTPTLAPGYDYCYVIEDIALAGPEQELPTIKVGASTCYGTAGIEVTLPVIGLVTVPGIELCFDRIVFGVIGVLGVTIDMDVLAFLVAAVVVLRMFIKS